MEEHSEDSTPTCPGNEDIRTVDGARDYMLKKVIGMALFYDAFNREKSIKNCHRFQHFVVQYEQARDEASRLIDISSYEKIFRETISKFLRR